jgi:hypothetical protein
MVLVSMLIAATIVVAVVIHGYLATGVDTFEDKAGFV